MQMNRFILVLVACMLFQALPAHAAKPSIETGPDAERSFDGLYRVKNPRLGAAWVRQGVDLSKYSKLMVRGAGIAYRPVDWSGSASAAVRRGETEFPINAANREKLAQELREQAMKELAKGKHYTLADEPGDDVLLLVVGLIDVVSYVPPETASFNTTFLRSVGEATLVLELRDSMTGAILARAADRRAASSGYMERADSVTAGSEVRRLGSSWGRLLRERLDDLMAMSGQIATGQP